MNKYTNTLRNILVKYWDVRKTGAEEYRNQKARGVYSDMAMNQLASKLDDMAQESYRAALADIDAAYQQCAAAVKAWGTLDGTKIVQADVALLNGGFSLTPQDMEDMIKRNASNATMCRLISGRMSEIKMMPTMESTEILQRATPTVKMGAYDAIFTKARNVLGSGRAYTVPQLADLLDSDYLPVMDHRFATIFDAQQHPEFARVLGIAGDGSELS